MSVSKEARDNRLREILLHNHPSPRSLSMDEKVHIVNKVIEMTINDPAQGTKEWASERQIGGSDTSSVVGKGYFGKNFFDVVRDRIFPGNGFSGNLATRFGRVMEEFSRKFIEKLFSTTVWEFKSLPNQLHYTSYSPDGLTVINILGKIMMLLLEFKTPLNRIPDGKIPREYLPQIKAGMCALPMVDGSLFMNTMLRICSFRDLQYNFDYNTRVHKSDTTTCKSRPSTHKSKLDKILAFGLCILIQTKEQRSLAEYYLADVNQVDGSQTNEYSDTSVVVFDSGPSLEEELFKSPILSIQKTLDQIYQSSNNRYALYDRIKHNYPNLNVPDFNIGEQKLHKHMYLSNNELFKDASVYENEKDYGNESEVVSDSIFAHVDQNKYISMYHIPPYLVLDNLAKIQLLKDSGLINGGNVNPDTITADMQIYMIESINFFRRELEKQSVHIVGFIPYKVFKMDLIFQPNDDPLFMRSQVKPHIDVYAQIKAQCNAIDVRTDLTDEEKNTHKWDILFKFFPDKKPAVTSDDVTEGLIEKLDADDFMF